MRPLQRVLPALLLLTGCNDSGAPAARSGVDWPAWTNPIYRLAPQRPEDRPRVVKQPYELEVPRGSASEVEHENSIRLYGPGLSRKRQLLV
jgi:hypothetical protein